MSSPNVLIFWTPKQGAEENQRDVTKPNSSANPISYSLKPLIWRQVARWQTLQYILVKLYTDSPCCERPHCGHCPRFQCGWRGWDRWPCGEWHPWFGRRRSRGASLQGTKTDFDEFRVSQTNTTTTTLMSKTQRLLKTNRNYVRKISGVRKFYYFVVKCSG